MSHAGSQEKYTVVWGALRKTKPKTEEIFSLHNVVPVLAKEATDTDERKGQGAISFSQDESGYLINIQEDPSSDWPLGYTQEGVFIGFLDLSLKKD